MQVFHGCFSIISFHPSVPSVLHNAKCIGKNCSSYGTNSIFSQHWNAQFWFADIKLIFKLLKLLQILPEYLCCQTVGKYRKLLLHYMFIKLKYFCLPVRVIWWAQQGSEDDVFGWQEYSALPFSVGKCKYCNIMTLKTRLQFSKVRMKLSEVQMYTPIVFLFVCLFVCLHHTGCVRIGILKLFWPDISHICFYHLWVMRKFWKQSSVIPWITWALHIFAFPFLKRHKLEYYIYLKCRFFLKCSSPFLKRMLIYNLMFPCIKIYNILLDQN